MRIVSKISMILFLLAAPFLLIGFGGELLRIAANISLHNARWTYFLSGAFVFLPCLLVGKKLFHSAWCWLETFEHELTHLLIGLLFLKIPVGFRVSAHAGGEVRQIGRGATGQTWVTLAPYFFPTVSLAVLLAAYLFPLDTFVLLGLLGWTTAFHLVSNWGETSFRQPDLQKAGIVKTILILPLMNVIFYGAILAFVGDGGKESMNFLTKGLAGTLNAIVGLWKYF